MPSSPVAYGKNTNKPQRTENKNTASSPTNFHGDVAELMDNADDDIDIHALQQDDENEYQDDENNDHDGHTADTAAKYRKSDNSSIVGFFDQLILAQDPDQHAESHDDTDEHSHATANHSTSTVPGTVDGDLFLTKTWPVLALVLTEAAVATSLARAV